MCLCGVSEESQSCHRSQSSSAGGETGSSGTPRRRIQTAPPAGGQNRGRQYLATHQAPAGGQNWGQQYHHGTHQAPADRPSLAGTHSHVSPHPPTRVHFPELTQTSSMPYTIVRVNRTNHPNTHIGVPESLILPMAYQLGVSAESPTVPGGRYPTPVINPPVTPSPQVSGPFSQAQQDNLDWVTRMTTSRNQFPKLLNLYESNKQMLSQNQSGGPQSLPNCDLSSDCEWVPPSPGIAEAQLPRVKFQPRTLEDCRPTAQKTCMSTVKIITYFLHFSFTL